MKITHCKFLRKQQLRLLDFLLEVTARSAAGVCSAVCSRLISGVFLSVGLHEGSHEFPNYLERPQ